MYLCIDLGSTTLKAAVFGPDLRETGRGLHRLQYSCSRAGEAEIAIEQVHEALRNIIRDALKGAGVQALALNAIGLSSQAQTFTILDQDGRAKIPFISWQDSRAARTAQQLSRERKLAAFHEHCSIGSLYPGLKLCLLRHLLNANPRLLATHDTVAELSAYVVFLLCSRTLIDDNLAAMSGFYSLVENDWWPPALQACGLSNSHLPALRKLGAVAAITSKSARRLGLRSGLPLVLAGNDQTAGAYGAQIHKRNALLITLGTAQVAYTACRTMPKAHPQLMRGICPEGLFYRMGADYCGGNSILWGVSTISGCLSEEQFFELAEQSPPGSRGLCFKPMPAYGGVWIHKTARHTAADQARAILETLVERMTRIVHQLRKDVGSTPIYVAGGGSRALLWLKLLEDKLGAGLQTVAADPLLGTARLVCSACAMGAPMQS
jgi:gluconokinase